MQVSSSSSMATAVQHAMRTGAGCRASDGWQVATANRRARVRARSGSNSRGSASPSVRKNRCAHGGARAGSGQAVDAVEVAAEQPRSVASRSAWVGGADQREGDP